MKARFLPLICLLAAGCSRSSDALEKKVNDLNSRLEQLQSTLSSNQATNDDRAVALRDFFSEMPVLLSNYNTAVTARVDGLDQRISALEASSAFASPGSSIQNTASSAKPTGNANLDRLVRIAVDHGIPLDDARLLAAAAIHINPGSVEDQTQWMDMSVTSYYVGHHLPANR